MSRQFAARDIPSLLPVSDLRFPSLSADAITVLPAVDFATSLTGQDLRTILEVSNG